ncbi:MAG: 1,4-alpha-glucan branching protein GlgB [Candidatus Omnitrophica bacterium]|nr:1,4-alpha-glucan branching protein GlgB [Candidatus Omnitrophota bacterium]
MEKQRLKNKDPVLYDISIFTEHDVYLFKEGSHFRIYKNLGSHIGEHEGLKGTYFAVWAPSAKAVSVMGDFNDWSKSSHPLNLRFDMTGIWEGFIPNLGKGTKYKYFIESKFNGYQVDKRDPYAFYCEVPPDTASIIWDLDYTWHDQVWMERRKDKNALNAPYNVYEIHFGSWRRKPEEGNRSLTYREMAEELVPYLKEMGYTHVEFLPLMAFPFEGSWGYQSVGYFAPTSRYGTPQDLKFLIDCFHQNEIGVIMDWVPSHFPSDEHGLAYFDGTNLYEHADPRKGFHPDWKSYIFNYGRRETLNFLISSALFWLEEYHIDGLRVDGVASMLYLDYSRKEGEWIPNEYGGRENTEAIAFLKRLNEMVYKEYPGVQTIAEESTAWPRVSGPTYLGGLGFGMKWNMGWMHDVLQYFRYDPLYRQHHHHELTFSFLYAFNENFMLSLSHDEVVHGKGALLNKMPGDDWQKFANLRALYTYMYTHPGKQLLFMGGEFGQWREWNHDASLDWHLCEYDPHRGIQQMIKELNHIYLNEPALWQQDFSEDGFEWIDPNDWQHSVISFYRKGLDPKDLLLVVCNLTPVVRQNYHLGVSQPGGYVEIFNSDEGKYGGSGILNGPDLESTPICAHGHFNSLSLTLPPLGISIYKKT